MKRIYLNILFPIFILAFLITGCDKIKEPYLETENIIDTGATAKQNVYVEYFTGHRCPNCPAAAHILKELKEEYKDRLVFVSIHAGSFAELIGQNYQTDYRTTVGNELDAFFQVTTIGTPNGLINRKNFDEGLVLSPNNWSSLIASELLKEPAFQITVQSASITNYSLNVKTRVKTLKQIEGAAKLTVYISEDSLQSYQKNSNSEIGAVPEITDYQHRFVLRGSMNGTWGDTLFTQSVNIGEYYDKEYTKQISPEWNQDRLYLVLFVSDVTTDEVFQVLQYKIK